VKQKFKQAIQNPKVKVALKQMKPERNILGFLGVFILIILPELIALAYGNEIVTYARTSLLNQDISIFSEYYLKGLLFLFEEGVSYVNLVLGCIFLIWMFF